MRSSKIKILTRKCKYRFEDGKKIYHYLFLVCNFLNVTPCGRLQKELIQDNTHRDWIYDLSMKWISEI